MQDLIENLLADQQKRASVAKLKNTGVNPTDAQSHLQGFATPGFNQAQVMAKAGKCPIDSSTLKAIADGVLAQAQKTKDGDFSNIEVILHSQIAMLSTLSTHFMNKALAGYDSSEVLAALPHIPSELAELSLKCQAEMRKCMALLHELKNPKKPSQFIKNYVHQQLNQLQVEQEQLKQQLEGTRNAPVDIGSERTPTPDNSAVETLAPQHRTKNPGRKRRVKAERTQARTTQPGDD